MKVINGEKRNISLLLAAQFISIIGNELQSFALSLYVLKVTNSAVKFASVLAASFIPRIILGPIAGVFVDWFDRKVLIVILDILDGIYILVFSMMYFRTGHLSINSIYILCILLSITVVFYSPAISALVPSIVKKEELLKANSIKSTLENAARFAAPMLAGILLSFSSILIIFIINFISFITAALIESLIQLTNKINKNGRVISVELFKEDFIKGISFIKNNRKLYMIIFFACIFNGIYTSLTIGFTFTIKKFLHSSDLMFGFFQSSLAVAMILGPFISSLISSRFKAGSLMFFSTFIKSIVVTLLAVVCSTYSLHLFSNNTIPYLLVLVLAFIITCVALIGAVALNTAIQKEIPVEIMGKVMGVIGTFTMLAIPFSQMLSGLAYDNIYLWLCMLIIAVSLLLCAIGFKKILYLFNE